MRKHIARILAKNKDFVREMSLIGGALFFVCVGLFLLWIATFKIPDLRSFEGRKITESTKIYDRTGTVLLYDVFQNTKRTIVPFSTISRHIKNATVAIEDAEFYQHHGIKFTSIARAILANIGAGSYSQGGSTITQQVVKNSVLTSEKRISRKLKEWVLSLKLERVLGKDEILSLYVNESPYGGSLYGVQEASKAFFGKTAETVTLAEAAYIAALPKAPSYYSPYGIHLKELETRKNLVLKKMLENQFISKAEYASALAEKVEFKPEDSGSIKAPHFVLYVKDYLEKKYGKKAVEENGLKVITTLNYDLQQKAEKLAFEYALKNKVKYNASNIALVAIDPTNGDILTMVGSRDYFDKEIEGNFNVATANRQPGSTFKPFAYATAFIKGYTPDTVLFDLRTEFQQGCNPDGSTPTTTPTGEPLENGCYSPENYDGIYRGPMTLRDALAQSINVVAIKTLYLAGPKDALKVARDMGISSLSDPNQYGLTLVLGGGEVSPLEMTSAYGVFAQSGVRNPHHAILRVEDKKGTVLEQFVPRGVQVLPEQSALQISDILSDEKAREPAFGSRSYLYVPGHPSVAVKTGTTNDYRDAWIIGYTPHFVAGAWAGNNDNSQMEKKVAGFIIAPFWNDFMKQALESVPDEPFKKPERVDQRTLKSALRGMWQGGMLYTIDKVSGKLATEYTPEELKEDRVVKNIHSILYWVSKNDPRGPAPADPASDPQFANWEYSVQKWAKENNIQNESPDLVPTTYDSVHGPNFIPRATFVEPKTNISYSKDSQMTVSLGYTSTYPLSRADIYVNGLYIGSSTNLDGSFSFQPSELESLQTENTLTVILYDSVLNRGEISTTFRVE